MADTNSSIPTKNSPSQTKVWEGVAQRNGVDYPPSDWIETTLGEVVEIQPGFAFKSKDFETNQGFPVIKIKNIQPPIIRIGKEDVVDISEYSSEKLEKFKVKNGEYLIAMTGETIGKVGKYNLGNFAYINQRVCKVVKTEKSDYNFIYYTLLQDSFQKFINTHSFGVAQANISTDQIGKFKILLPPLPEQQAIASVLSAFDDKIELLREQNKTLEEMGQTIFKEWLGKYGVYGELPEGDAVSLPNGWRVGKVKDIVDIFDSQRIPLSSNQRQEKQGKYPYHGATSIMDYVDEYLFDGIYLLLAEDGSVMDQNGYPVLQYVWDKFWVNNHAHVLQGSNDFSTEMLYLFFKNTKITSIINGAVQLKINQTNLMNLEVIIPDQETLKQFDEAIQPVFEKIRDNSEQIQSLAHSRDELLPKLMRGEVRVRYQDIL